ncbi:MAG: Isoaspartyl peptidase [Ignavibacteria bacterium]|nr:Isoaspartyl peptidase [Ignavibacteria bacterium]
MNSKFCIAIHGGAGTILKSKMTPEKEELYRKSLETALITGYDVLKNNGNAVDAVEQAVIAMEDNPLFNAGKGSVFTNNGDHKMDASIMNGSNLKAGCAASVSNVKNPVALARKIMEKSNHVLLAGKGAEDFAKSEALKFESDKYFFTEFRYKQYQNALKSENVYLDHSVIEDDNSGVDKKFGTVGAVALDNSGNLAAATSTGGMTNVKFGRIGDSPVIGAGTYADNNTCAVSCTGDGEYFLRALTAFDVSALMQYKGLSLEEACKEAVFNKLAALGGSGGLIAVDSAGNISMVFNSEGMYRGYIDMNGKMEIGIFKV